MKPPVVAHQSPGRVACVADRGHAAAFDEGLGDLRFRALLSAPDSDALPPTVRWRFFRRLAGGRTVVYVGRVAETRMSRAGWCLAQAARLIGAPLPLGRDGDVPAVVAVTEDRSGGGQNWTRLYVRRAGLPQIIHSAKRFAGPTGLEEYVGCGVGMAPTVHVEPGALVFRSAGYFARLLGRRVAWPAWPSPGHLTATHGARDDGAFTFTLDLVHPRVHTAIFREAAP